ncbi:hypothetical protein DOM22_03250 [Bdellovibrio sp. ZAP7]|nr:hypothetical protein DOM22_03250 [Bdellovibrio sp. ZAP7]
MNPALSWKVFAEDCLKDLHDEKFYVLIFPDANSRVSFRSERDVFLILSMEKAISGSLYGGTSSTGDDETCMISSHLRKDHSHYVARAHSVSATESTSGTPLAKPALRINWIAVNLDVSRFHGPRGFKVLAIWQV